MVPPMVSTAPAHCCDWSGRPRDLQVAAVDDLLGAETGQELTATIGVQC